MKTVDADVVCRTIRQLRREQMRTSLMNRAALDFIIEHGLVTETHWPGYVLSISPAGLEYLREHEADGD